MFSKFHAARFAALSLLVLVALAACSSSDQPPDTAWDQSILSVRDYLANTSVEGDPANPSCLFLIERDGPRSVQWVSEEGEKGFLTVEARKGGLPVRGFSWSYDWRTKEVTTTSGLC